MIMSNIDCKWYITSQGSIILYCNTGSDVDSVLFTNRGVLYRLLTWLPFNVKGTLPKGKDYSNLYYSKL